MKSLFYIVLLILCIAFIVFLIWNFFNFRSNRTNSSEKFLELKYQLQFYVAIFTTIIATIAFFGYNEISDLEKKVKEDVKNQTDSILQTTLKEQQKIREENGQIKIVNQKLETNADKTNDRFYNLLTMFGNLQKDFITSDIQLKNQIRNVQDAQGNLDNIQKDVIEIKKLEFLKQMHIVTNRHFESKTEIDTVKFSSLTTINGQKLPKFNSAPSVVISVYTGIIMTITEITKDYFILRADGSGAHYNTEDDYPENWKYNLLIIHKESK